MVFWTFLTNWYIMTIMTLMRNKRRDTRTALNIAEAKKHFSDLLGRVAYGGETIWILRRGKPMAKLVPPGPIPDQPHLADVRGWLEDDDPFFSLLEKVQGGRRTRRPRVVAVGRRGAKPRRRGSQGA
jgi:prevent-host-death family protein